MSVYVCVCVHMTPELSSKDVATRNVAVEQICINFIQIFISLS